MHELHKEDLHMKRTIIIGIAACLIAGIASVAPAARTGKQVYESLCLSCHATGVANAPQFGNKVWTELEKKKGMKGLLDDAIKGKNVMPPKGGCTDCTNDELRAAIQYMIDSAKKK